MTYEDCCRLLASNRSLACRILVRFSAFQFSFKPARTQCRAFARDVGCCRRANNAGDFKEPLHQLLGMTNARQHFAHGGFLKETQSNSSTEPIAPVWFSSLSEDA